MAHAPLLLDTALDLSPSKPLGFRAARALVRSRNYHLLLFQASFSGRCLFDRRLLPRNRFPPFPIVSTAAKPRGVRLSGASEESGWNKTAERIRTAAG